MINQTKKKDRITWIDMAKGYGILLVIWAHLIDEGAHNWIYTFHMPLFFFLSGYVFSCKYDFVTFIKRKSKAIIIPYFVLGIPMLLFDGFRQWRHGALSKVGCFNQVILFLKQERLWTLWFIAALFWVNLVFFCMVKLIKKQWILLLVSIFMAIIGLCYYENGGKPLFWNMDVCLTAVPFFCVGYLYKCNSEKVQDLFEKKWKVIGAFTVFLAINLVCGAMTWKISGEGLEMFYSKYGSPLFTYMAAFAGTFCVIILAKQWTFSPIRYIGENSMLYYAWHQTIMIPIATKVMEKLGVAHIVNTGVFGIILYKIGCMVIIVGVTTICNEVFKWLRSYKRIVS